MSVIASAPSSFAFSRMLSRSSGRVAPGAMLVSRRAIVSYGRSGASSRVSTRLLGVSSESSFTSTARVYRAGWAAQPAARRSRGNAQPIAVLLVTTPLPTGEYPKMGFQANYLGLRSAPAIELSDELGGFHADGSGDLEELDDIEAPLAVLVLRDIGLGAGELPGEGGLREALRSPGLDQELTEAVVLGGEGRSGHKFAPQWEGELVSLEWDNPKTGLHLQQRTYRS